MCVRWWRERGRHVCCRRLWEIRSVGEGREVDCSHLRTAVALYITVVCLLRNRRKGHPVIHRSRVLLSSRCDFFRHERGGWKGCLNGRWKDGNRGGGERVAADERGGAGCVDESVISVFVHECVCGYIIHNSSCFWSIRQFTPRHSIHQFTPRHSIHQFTLIYMPIPPIHLVVRDDGLVAVHARHAHVRVVHRHVAQNGRVLHHDRSLGDEVVHQLHRRRGGVSDDLEVPILGRQMLVDALRLNVGGSNARDSDASVRSRRSVTCGWVRTSPQLRSAVSPRSPPLDSGRVPRE